MTVAREMGNNRGIVHVEKQIEPCFIELGFEHWKPEIHHEELRVATPSYLLEV